MPKDIAQVKRSKPPKGAGPKIIQNDQMMYKQGSSTRKNPKPKEHVVE